MMQTDNTCTLSRLLTKFNLKNLISEPTRITNTTATCLDLLITNHNSIINNYEILPPFHSDHCTVTAEVAYKTYRIRHKRKLFGNMMRPMYNKLKTKLENTDWSFIQNLTDINQINSIFTNILLDTANEFYPQKGIFKSTCR